MARQRMIATSIWKRSRKFKRCDPVEKLLYLHLISNDELTLCGAYEYDLDEIALYTGIDARTLPAMLTHLEELGLVVYRDGWVVVKNYIAQQNVNNSKVKAGIEASMRCVPDDLRCLIYDSSSVMPDIDLDSDLDVDSDSDIDTDSPARIDPVLVAYRDGIEAHLPALAWPDTHKQHAALKEITDKTKALAPDSAIPDPVEFAGAILQVFARKKAAGKNDYWKGAAWEPVVIARRFGELVTGLSDEYQRARAWGA